jgi:hypothetical protein
MMTPRMNPLFLSMLVCIIANTLAQIHILQVLTQGFMTQYIVDGGELPGMSSIKDDPVNGSRPSRYAVNNSESWLAPESWESIPSGLPQKPQVVIPEEVTSDDLEQSDFESWDFEKKKLATLRIFRADTTYTTVHCGYSISASELCAMLARKIFKPDTSKYHLYISRNNIGMSTCFILPQESLTKHCKMLLTGVVTLPFVLCPKFAPWSHLKGRCRSLKNVSCSLGI